VKRLLLLLSAILCTGHGIFAAAQPPPQPTPPPEVTADSLVRVNSTNQSYDFFRPWTKKAPSVRRGLGVVVAEDLVLVTAELVTNRTYVELENATTNAKSAADVVSVDYDSNLALLRPANKEVLKGARPLALDDSARVGERVDLIQLESNSAVAKTPGTITTINVSPYPLGQLSLLTYRISSPLQGRDGSFVIPAVKDGKLLGLLMRYDSRSQTADVVPSPVIAHFLADAKSEKYLGFPRVGLGFASTRDPQLRRFIGLQDDGGVYVTAVRPGSAGEKGGLKKGDVILSVAGKDIDQDGNYDDAAYGKIPFSHLTSTLASVGDKLDFVVFRDGQKQTLPITLEAANPDLVRSEPYTFDRAPRYYILGGLVFEELSRSYLQEWGGNWPKEAPQQLVALDAFQDEDTSREPGKIVFLSQVFPTGNTVGYENLQHLVVTKVNGVPIKSLDDLAKAAAKPEGGFHKIEFDADPPFIYLDAAEAEKSDEQIRQEYGVSELKNLN